MDVKEKGVIGVYIVSIDESQCSGCAACTEGCPVQLLKIKGDKAEVAGDETECMGCETCTTVCPTGAVAVVEM